MGALKYMHNGSFVPFGDAEIPVDDYVACSGSASVANGTPAMINDIPYNDADLANADYVVVTICGYTGNSATSVTMGGQSAASTNVSSVRHSGQNTATQSIIAIFDNTSGQLGTSGNIRLNYASSQWCYCAVVWVGMKGTYSGLSAHALAYPASAGRIAFPDERESPIRLMVMGGYISGLTFDSVDGPAEIIDSRLPNNGWAIIALVGLAPSALNYPTGVSNPMAGYRLLTPTPP